VSESSLRPVRGTAEELLRLLRGWRDAEDPPPLVIETSGSTGRPKRVVLSRAAMLASVAATHARLGGPGQWVLNLPPHHVAGVQVLFRSVVAGLEPIIATDPVTAVEAVTADRAYLSVVPTQLVRALRDDRVAAALTRFDTVLVGGGPLDPRVRTEAEQRGVQVVQSYGMSETCGGCVYDGRPLDGVRLRVDDGQVLVGGAVLFEGYDGEPERTAEVLADGWLRTADLGRIADDGRLEVLGRVDDVVISGGVNVPTPAVARMLRDHPDVEDAHVVGVPDPEWGSRVVAVVVADPVPPLDELRDLVTPRSWAPRGVVPVDVLPLLANGKVDRLRVEEVAAGG
jgi:o-succinylbenzoate---CoA ligase